MGTNTTPPVDTSYGQPVTPDPFYDPSDDAWGTPLATCEHGHALCSTCHTGDRNTTPEPEEPTSRKTCQEIYRPIQTLEGRLAALEDRCDRLEAMDWELIDVVRELVDYLSGPRHTAAPRAAPGRRHLRRV